MASILKHAAYQVSWQVSDACMAEVHIASVCNLWCKRDQMTSLKVRCLVV